MIEQQCTALCAQDNRGFLYAVVFGFNLTAHREIGFIDVRDSSELLGNPFAVTNDGLLLVALVSLLMRRSIK